MRYYKVGCTVPNQRVLQSGLYGTESVMYDEYTRRCWRLGWKLGWKRCLGGMTDPSLNRQAGTEADIDTETQSDRLRQTHTWTCARTGSGTLVNTRRVEYPRSESEPLLCPALPTMPMMTNPSCWCPRLELCSAAVARHSRSGLRCVPQK